MGNESFTAWHLEKMHQPPDLHEPEKSPPSEGPIFRVSLDDSLGADVNSWPAPLLVDLAVIIGCVLSSARSKNHVFSVHFLLSPLF
jgi:hypothetical protein